MARDRSQPSTPRRRRRDRDAGRAPQVTLIGDGSAAPSAAALAEEVGRRVAARGWTLVTGGRAGVMEAASRGARLAGGLVLGVLPGVEVGEGNPYLTAAVPTGLGHGRNLVNVLSADAVVVIGGGAGTLSELAFAWLHGKRILALTGTGGWADRLAGRPVDGTRRDVVEPCASPEVVEQRLAELFCV